MRKSKRALELELEDLVKYNQSLRRSLVHWEGQYENLFRRYELIYGENERLKKLIYEDEVAL